MTIYAYVGKPGSGKSYSVVENVIIPALKAGRTIYHNFQLNERLLYEMCGDTGTLMPFPADCTPAQLVEGAPLGALIVIDESLRYWPSGTRSNKIPVAELEFFTKHRHRVGEDGRSTDIVIVCQELGSQCCAFIRELVEFTYRCVKLSAFGLSKRYRLETYEGAIKGDRPPQSRIVRKRFCTYRKEIYACYTSHTQSQKGVAGEEIRDEKISIWRNWSVIAAAIAIPTLIVCAYLSVHFFYSLAPEPTTAEQPPTGAVERSETAPVGGFRPPVRPEPSIRQMSVEWRLSGQIQVGDQLRIVLESERHTRLIAPAGCQRDHFGQFECTVDGMIVTAWTGPTPSAVAEIFKPVAPSL